METNETHWSGTILYVVAWLICCLLVVLDVLQIREASRDIMTLYQVRQVENAASGTAGTVRIRTGFSLEAIDQGLLFIGGIAAVGLAIGLEYYFRKGLQQGELRKRVLRVGGILVVVYFLSFLVERLL